MKKLLSVVIGVAGMGFAATAFAYYCVGTIDFIAVSPSGIVTVGSSSSGLGGFYVCQIGATADGVGPDTCKAILATLEMAKATGSQVSWAFSDSLSCDRASYNGGNWYWLGSSPSGWYYGPQVQ